MTPDRKKHTHFLTDTAINDAWEKKFYTPAYYEDPEPPHCKSMTALVCEHLEVMCGLANRQNLGSYYSPWYERSKEKKKEQYWAKKKAAANGI